MIVAPPQVRAILGQLHNRKQSITANVDKRLPCRSAGEWLKVPQVGGPNG
jgi:hypothetical protein